MEEGHVVAAIAKPLVAGVGQDNGQCIFEALRVSLEEVSGKKFLFIFLCFCLLDVVQERMKRLSVVDLIKLMKAPGRNERTGWCC